MVFTDANHTITNDTLAMKIYSKSSIHLNLIWLHRGCTDFSFLLLQYVRRTFQQTNCQSFFLRKHELILFVQLAINYFVCATAILTILAALCFDTKRHTFVYFFSIFSPFFLFRFNAIANRIYK